ncbi:hypothetical protein K1719_000734 [Acacia pycnantha]|nr:hypothetical protein K1719_000734 [Acacia pycnantha]
MVVDHFRSLFLPKDEEDMWYSTTTHFPSLDPSIVEQMGSAPFDEVSASASSPRHFITVLLTCKRLNQLGLNRLVLSRVSEKNDRRQSQKLVRICSPVSSAMCWHR